MRHLLTWLVVMTLLLGACGGADEGDMGDHGGMGTIDTSSFGRPGDMDAADLTISISTLDTFRFEPAEVAIEKGQTIAFEVTNDGELPHEFVLGTEAFQERHEMGMADAGTELPPDEPYAVGVEPGETKTVAWTFTKSGTFLYGCHVEDHYTDGMVGTIAVEG
jgi:uncharacterized cupredoxin-like copper-binding protein